MGAPGARRFRARVARRNMPAPPSRVWRQVTLRSGRPRDRTHRAVPAWPHHASLDDRATEAARALLAPPLVRATRNSIHDVWGERTPYLGGGEWPQRVDERVIEEPDRWVQSCCVLCSNGCALDI